MSFDTQLDYNYKLNVAFLSYNKMMGLMWLLCRFYYK